MKSIDSLLSNFYHEGPWLDEGSNIFLWNLSVKQEYVTVTDLLDEIILLETLSENELALYINKTAIGATSKIGAKEAVQWLASLKKWVVNTNA
ncbi:hypothetical protein [Teredinibacter turnerae]|uniref:hypothetical protein n=1 Tax=Teredinibacter turnerae TaxID=2426 RepID=UPI000563CE13|nr:hypothetical protein [Teredinibacter turnerae]